jgi:5-methylcytosine-specific restriction endonuclease McrA
MDLTKRWSMYVDACRSCESAEVPHFGRGYCRRCYKRLHHLDALGPSVPRRWSVWSDACVTCGRADRPHESRGVCHTCRQASYRASDAGRGAIARYIASDEGRAVRRECTRRYAQSDRGLDVTRHNARRQREAEAGVFVEVPVGYDRLVSDAFGGRCVACGAHDDLELDHHRPLEAGYSLLHNAVPLCRSCNARKGARDPRDFYGGWRAAEIAVALIELRERFYGGALAPC